MRDPGWRGAMLDVLGGCGPPAPRPSRTAMGTQAVRTSVDAWIVGASGALIVDGKTLMPPYSVIAIGDPPTLAAAMNVPGGAVDSVKRVGSVLRSGGRQGRHRRLATTKPRQYTQPVKMITDHEQDNRERNPAPDLRYTSRTRSIRRSGDEPSIGITDFTGGGDSATSCSSGCLMWVAPCRRQHLW